MYVTAYCCDTYMYIVSLTSTGQVQLSSNTKAQVCPGETVEFKCVVVNAPYLRWFADPEIPVVNPITYIPENSAGRVVHRGNVSANLTSIQRHQDNPLFANMTSTLTYPVWSSAEVHCENKSLSLSVSGKSYLPLLD